MSSANKKPKKAPQESTWPLMLAAAIFLLGVYLVLNAMKNKNSSAPTETETVDPRQAELNHDQKVEFYRRQLGEKLNRSRTIAEHEFYVEHAHADPAAVPTQEYSPSVDNLPMQYEHHDYAPREPSKLAEGYKPDAKVAYELQDEQNAQFWEEEARRLFLRQYLNNARLHGYELAIDQNYNVIVKKAPQKVLGQRNPSSVYSLETFNVLRFAPPFYLSPICYR